MKIVHVGLDLVPSSGGTVASIRDFSHVAESTIISFTDPDKLKSEGSAILNTIHVKISSGFLGLAFAWAPEFNRRKALEAINDADLIVCHTLLRYHVHWIKAIARKKNIPYWVVPHGCIDPYVFSYRSLVKKIWFNLFGRPFLKHADRVIFATEKEKSRAGQYYSGNNCRVIHWPVQAVDISHRVRAREKIRRRHGISADDKIIVQLGRLHSSKGVIEVITAFAKARLPSVHLFVIGPEETISHKVCNELAKSLEINNIHLIGPIFGDEKNDYLLASDVYISLSHKENFGYTTAEALSAGLPVILSPGNYLCDDLKLLECGWMLRDNLPETATSAIIEFSAMSIDKLNEMGQRGRCWALANLNYEKFAERVRLAAVETLK